MSACKLKEFFQVGGEYSMRNLTVFITILASTLIILYLGLSVTKDGNTRLPTEMFAMYLLAGGGVYGYGKYQDDKTKREQNAANAQAGKE